MKKLLGFIIGPVIRHTLTGAGAALATVGVLDSPETITQFAEPTTEFLTGTGVFAIGLLASVFKEQIAVKIIKRK